MPHRADDIRAFHHVGIRSRFTVEVKAYDLVPTPAAATTRFAPRPNDARHVKAEGEVVGIVLYFPLRSPNTARWLPLV